MTDAEREAPHLREWGASLLLETGLCDFLRIREKNLFVRWFMTLTDEELTAIVETLTDDERKQLLETLQTRINRALRYINSFWYEGLTFRTNMPIYTY